MSGGSLVPSHYKICFQFFLVISMTIESDAQRKPHSTFEAGACICTWYRKNGRWLPAYWDQPKVLKVHTPVGWEEHQGGWTLLPHGCGWWRRCVQGEGWGEGWAAFLALCSHTLQGNNIHSYSCYKHSYHYFYKCHSLSFILASFNSLHSHHHNFMDNQWPLMFQSRWVHNMLWCLLAMVIALCTERMGQ